MENRLEQFCCDCHYFDDTRDGAGICKRYPPTDKRASLDKCYTHDVKVHEMDWCGEFKQSIKPVEAPVKKKGKTNGTISH